MAFTFTIRKGNPLPPPDPSRNAIPFMWSAMQPGDDFFVPHSYWTGERGMDPTKLTTTKVRERIRRHFKDWRDKDTSRSHLGIQMRNTEEEGETGVQVWLAAVEAAQAEAPAETPIETSVEPTPAPTEAPAAKAKTRGRKTAKAA